MTITFTSEHKTFRLKNSAKLKSWIKKVIVREKHVCGDISYLFTDDETLLQINKQYLKHNTYTDIITFDYSDNKIVAGEIFISVDRVKENADKFKTSFENELHRVMIHGILHLCGYKDKTNADSKKMRSLEESALKLLTSK